MELPKSLFNNVNYNQYAAFKGRSKSYQSHSINNTADCYTPKRARHKNQSLIGSFLSNLIYGKKSTNAPQRYVRQSKNIGANRPIKTIEQIGEENMVFAPSKVPYMSRAERTIREAAARGIDFSSLNLTRYVHDEYDIIREHGAYARDYGNATFEDRKEAINEIAKSNIDCNRRSNLKPGTPVIITNNFWSNRLGNNSRVTERVSANVKASTSMIHELDYFMATGKYIDLNGNVQEIKNMTPFHYKIPANADLWNNRQDPVTFYFVTGINQETYNAIVHITARHARGTVNNANKDCKWLSYTEKYPTNEMVDILANEIKKYNPDLAWSLSMQKGKYGSIASMSSGQFQAYENILRYILIAMQDNAYRNR